MTERDTRTIEVPVWVVKTLDVVFPADSDKAYMERALRIGTTTRDEIDATVYVRERLAELEPNA